MAETTFQLTKAELQSKETTSFFRGLGTGLIVAFLVGVCSWGQGRNDGQKFGIKLVQAQAVQRGYGAYHLGKDSVEPIFAWNEPAEKSVQKPKKVRLISDL